MSARRRLLVLAYYFPPVGGGGVNRTLKALAGFSRAGWDATVLTVDAAAWAQDPSLLAAVPAGTRILRLPNPDWGRVPARSGASPQSGQGRGRLGRWLVPDLHVGWSALAAVCAAGFARSGAVQALYSTAPPYSAHLAGWLAARLGLPWLADFRDAWTTPGQRETLPAWRLALETRMEAAVLGRADRVVFASEGARQRALARRPGLDERSETLLTGFDAAEFTAVAGIVPGPDRLELVHAGSALQDCKGGSLDALLGALADWQRRVPSVADRTTVAFVGGEAALGERIERAGLAPWVHTEPYRPRGDLALRLGRAHRCLHLAPRDAAGADTVPGKLFDAVGSNRRVLAVAPRGALTDLLDRHDLGEWADPGDGDALLAQLQRLDGERGGPLATPSPTGRAALDVAVFQQRLAEGLESILARPARARLPEELSCP